MPKAEKKRPLRTISILLAGLCLPTTASADASGASMGYVIGVQPVAPGGLFFRQTGSRSTKPSCATIDRWVINVSTPDGQTMAATLLMAYSLHKRISITGTGTCTTWGDTETVLYFNVED